MVSEWLYERIMRVEPLKRARWAERVVWLVLGFALVRAFYAVRDGRAFGAFVQGFVVAIHLIMVIAMRWVRRRYRGQEWTSEKERR